MALFDPNLAIFDLILAIFGPSLGHLWAIWSLPGPPWASLGLPGPGSPWPWVLALALLALGPGPGSWPWLSWPWLWVSWPWLWVSWPRGLLASGLLASVVPRIHGLIPGYCKTETLYLGTP